MARHNLSGYLLLVIGVFFLGLAIPVYDQLVTEAFSEGGLLVSFSFFFFIVGTGIFFLVLAMNNLRGRR